jgi:hypothetical protein
MIGATNESIYEIIDRRINRCKIKTSCSDFAFKEPSPLKVVFGGKYFSQGEEFCSKLPKF